MKNVITFRLWTDYTDNLLDVLTYLFNKGSRFMPEEFDLEDYTENDYMPFTAFDIERKVKSALASVDVPVLDFLTEKTKNYFHLTIKKGSPCIIKLDIYNSNEKGFLDNLCDFYEYAARNLDPIFAFAHDFEDAKNTLSGIIPNTISKIYWINIFGRKLMELVANFEEVKALKFYSTSTTDYKDLDGFISFFRMCETPADYKSTKFKLLAEAFSLALAKNKRLLIKTPEKLNADRIK
jgi:hypothetical protein